MSVLQLLFDCEVTLREALCVLLVVVSVGGKIPKGGAMCPKRADWGGDNFIIFFINLSPP